MFLSIGIFFSLGVMALMVAMLVLEVMPDIILNFFLTFVLFFLHLVLFQIVILYKILNHNVHIDILFVITNTIEICIQRKSCDYILHFFLSIFYNLDIFLQFYVFSILQNQHQLFLHNLLFHEVVLDN